MLVAYDELKEACWALSALKKGAVHGVVKWCVDRLEDSGYGGNGLTVTSDQEGSICALRLAIAVTRKGDTTPYKLTCPMLEIQRPYGECSQDI